MKCIVKINKFDLIIFKKKGLRQKIGTKIKMIINQQ